MSTGLRPPVAVTTTLAERPVRPDAIRVVPSNRIERVVATTVIFFLAHNMPQIWMVKPFGQEQSGDSALTQLALLLAGTLFFAFASLQFSLGPFLQLLRQEPALPAFIVLLMASAAWSPVPVETLRQGVLLFGIMFVGYWLVVRFPLHEILGMAAVAFGVGALMQMFVIKFLPAYGALGDGWVGVFKNRNVFGRHLTLAILTTFIAARVHRRHRMVLYASALAMVFMLLNANSKTSLVGAIGTTVMTAVFVLFRARRTLYGAVVIVVSTVTVGVIVFALGNLEVITSRLNRDVSLTGRTQIWETMIPEIMKRPVWGYGWNGFFTNDWYGPARPIYLLGLGQVAHAHNALLQYAANLGLVGAGLALLITLRLIVRGARIVRYYDGAAGLFPLVFGGYVLITSITEYGVVATDSHFLLFVVAVAASTPGRRDALGRSGAIVTRAAAGTLRRAPLRPSLPPH